MIYPIVHFLTGSFVFYGSYYYGWVHIITLFEQLQTSSKVLQTASTQNLFALFKEEEESTDAETGYSRWYTVVKCCRWVSRVAFSMTISCSVVIIQFILWQFQHDGDIPALDLHLWNWNLAALIIVLVLIQPLTVCVLLFDRLLRGSSVARKLSACALTLYSWLIFASRSYRFTDLDVVDGSSMLSYYTQCISIMGVTLMGVLNGVGSYSTVYYYLYKGVTPTDELNEEAKRLRIEQLQSSIVKTEDMIRKLPTGDDNVSHRNAYRAKSSFLDLTMLSSSSSSSPVSSTKQELQSLTKLKNELYSKLMRVQTSLNTSSNKLFLTLNRVIGVYCLFKILQVTVIHILQFIHSNDINSSNSDPLVVTLAHVFELFVNQDEEFLVNQLSFIISGALFVLSFNGVFLTLTHMYRFLPIDVTSLQRSKKSVSVIKNLILSELLGTYVLATLLILKSNLSTTYSQSLGSLTMTQGVDIAMVDNWFNKVYLLSVVITGVLIKIGETWLDDDGFENDSIASKIV